MKLIRASFDGLVEVGEKMLLAEIKEYSDEYIRNHGISLTKNEVKSFHELRERTCLVVYNTTKKKYFLFSGQDISDYLDRQKRSFATTHRALYRMFSKKGEPKVKIFDPVFEEKILELSRKTLQFLKPKLANIEGVFLFGSFARNEQKEKSDIDLLVIADKKIDLGKKEKFDFLIKTREQFEIEIRTDSTLFPRQVVSEAKPILNESLLDELKKVKPKPDFKEVFDSTLGAFKKTKELLEMNHGTGLLESNVAIYSLILRLKTLFIIQCHKKSIAFSNKKFKELLEKYGFSEQKINALLEVWQAERDNKKTSQKILLADALKLFDAAKIEFLKTEALVKK
ncbi:MAG: nucleotidyltransferase domain-containing protein [Candidatus ainarchaeum sp.]|nr:nucleotidyltransferase domain-containing protein [Candidatus ainarchaeum sp.]